ncbi:iron oxidase precursor (Fe(II) oxidase) [Scleromatobacter humisilvae]|uniref:Iron oxidase (Fe(II) oxidase) n=1 Tax=Scleromatobacter humisilvae TaxID=2897159 RepID=A0A9X1YJ00_9BURK|nr:iron oxidase precursor (Fe(II) oxidase) [Scleromatobacter humisilvae]MCK9687038.1 iron oxidase precursor (Fe(II) oxidase) [Scleromatobacter humisilvae]
MEDQRTDGLSRRRALQRTAALGVGVTIAWAAGTPARAQAKLAKAAVKYVDKGDMPGKDCDDCVHYIAPAKPKAPATCQLVEGPIRPHGHCIAFSPKT